MDTKKYKHLDAIPIENFVSKDDPDIAAIDYCFHKLGGRACNHCNEVELEIWDIFYDYFLQRLKRRTEEGE